MWFIEFFQSKLKGIVLPIHNEIGLSGNNDSDNNLYVPESLPKNEKISIFIDEKDNCKIKINNKKEKKLTANNIINIRGIVFTIYKENERNPKFIKYNLKRFWFYIPLFLIFSITLYVLIDKTFLFLKSNYIKKQISHIGSGYIKDGVLFSFNRENINHINKSWQENITFIEKKKKSSVSQFNIKLYSPNHNHLQYKIIPSDLYDEIIVQDYYKDNQIMSLFGEHSIGFKKTKEKWLVTDLKNAQDLLAKHKFVKTIKKLSSFQNNNNSIIDKNDFPYSVFYSSKTGGYLYNKKARYWEGSYIEKLGIIKKITSEKVVFQKGNQTKVWFIK